MKDILRSSSELRGTWPSVSVMGSFLGPVHSPHRRLSGDVVSHASE